MIIPIILMLIGFATSVFGILLALTGPNGHPAGIPVMYLGVGIVFCAIVWVVGRLKKETK